MTRYETLTSRKQLLVQRLKQSKQYMSTHQIRVLRKRIQRYNQVIKILNEHNPLRQLRLV